MMKMKKAQEPKGMSFRKAQEPKGMSFRKAQEPKGMSFRKAQEEIVGFSMIIVIVAVILVIFFSFSIRSPQKSTVESYEVESFLNALMQKTTDCKSVDNLRYYSIKELMYQCYLNAQCINGKGACDVISTEIGVISNQSWNIGKGSAIKGYSFNISADGVPIKVIGYGNQTRTAKKGATQDDLIMHGKTFKLEFLAYY